MGDKRRVANQSEQIAGDLGKGRRLRHVTCGDSVNMGSANVSLGIHQRGVLVHLGAVSVETYDRDLDNAIASFGEQTGGLEVDDREPFERRFMGHR